MESNGENLPPTGIDLFEDIRVLVDADYISDIRISFIDQSRAVMARLPLDRYPVRALEDMAAYLYGAHPRFKQHQDAEMFFRESAAGTCCPLRCR